MAPTLETDLIEVLRTFDAVCGLDAGPLDGRAVRVGETLVRVDELADLSIRHAFARAEHRTNGQFLEE